MARTGIASVGFVGFPSVVSNDEWYLRKGDRLCAISALDLIEVDSYFLGIWF